MNTDYKYYCRLGWTALLLLAIAGCVSTEPVRVEEGFGKSVNQMVQAQTYNPEAAARTESLPVKEMDGKMAVDSLNALRKETARDTETLNSVINVQIGAGGGS